METVGIRELKTHLSRHLKRLQSGVRLLVTERGRSIATINPVETAAEIDWATDSSRKGTHIGMGINRRAVSGR
jgi:antitoxin (DNA-binding transcriptional repressor) of toxin-antitoxin stability system